MDTKQGKMTMILETLRLNRLARSVSLNLIENSIYIDHNKVNSIIHGRLGNRGKSNYILVKTAKQKGSNPASQAMEMATEITLSLLGEVPEYYKFDYVTNIHQIIQNLFNRLYCNINKNQHQRVNPKK